MSLDFGRNRAFSTNMAEPETIDLRDQRREAIRSAYVDVTTGERVRLTPTVSVPAGLLRRLHPSITPVAG